MTVDNIVAHTALTDIPGWKCDEIKTDMDIGTVKEFIEKEGKWFNYIKGKTINNTDILDTSLFNVQGVGTVATVSAYTPL